MLEAVLAAALLSGFGLWSAFAAIAAISLALSL
jgi:hypothetical protein